MARGQLRDFERYAANVGIPYDSIKNELFPPLNYHGGDDYEEKDRPRREYINKSLLCTALGSYIYNAIDEKRLLLLLNLFLRKFGYSQENILHGMEVTIDYRMGLAHLAAAYDRQDLLKWLVMSKNMYESQ